MDQRLTNPTSDIDADHEHDEAGPPAKRKRLYWHRCLCHCHDDESGELTPFTARSWAKLQEAASVHRDAIQLLLADHFKDGPRGGYHRRCYASYTNKTLLERLEQRREKSELSTPGDQTGMSLQDPVCACSSDPSQRASDSQPGNTFSSDPPVRRSRSSVPSTDLSQCVICQTVKKKNKHTLEPVSQCLTEQASATLLNAARIRGDGRVLLAIERQDLIAIEVRYHRSCYSSYTHNSG